MIGLMAETTPERSHELWHQFKNAVKSMPSYIPIVNFIKAEEAHHWEGTATELLTILQAREPILVSYSAAVFSKSLKAAQDSLREIYGVSYVSAFHNKKKWITLDYIEVK